MKEIYDQILNDSKIKDIYNQIHDYEDNTEKGWAYHDYNHVLNVANLVEQILKSLNCSSDFIYSAKIASILHDVGALEGKENHSIRSYKFAKKYFEINNIYFENLNDVLEAIKIHSDGFDTENLIASSLILADKLDVKYTRIAKEGEKIIGNRQYKNILDIKIDYQDNTFIFSFLSNSNLDLQELNNYYFTKKIFNAIKSFCDKFNKQYLIKMNNELWYL